jgi:hypothetical protein
LFNKLFKAKTKEEPYIAEKAEETEEAEEELIAVISAAISALTDTPVSDFRVVSFRERKNWNLIYN